MIAVSHLLDAVGRAFRLGIWDANEAVKMRNTCLTARPLLMVKEIQGRMSE
jgi:hypothetical protein